MINIEELKKKHISIKYYQGIKIIGYYLNDDQKMYNEPFLTECAEDLSEKLNKSFSNVSRESVLKQINVDEDSMSEMDLRNKIDEFFTATDENAVLILRDKDWNLYAYYPYEGTVRITNVRYNPEYIYDIPEPLRAWFTPGEPYKAVKHLKERTFIIY